MGAPWKLPLDAMLAVRQHDRIVDGCGQLPFGHGASVVEGVANRARHLRRATEAVGILHPWVVVPVRRHDLGAGQQPADVVGAGRLPGVGPQRDELGPHHLIGAEQRLDAGRGGDVGHPEQAVQVVDGEDQHAEHAVGTVDEGQALLGLELDRSKPGLAQQYVRRVDRAARVRRLGLLRAASGRSGRGAPGRHCSPVTRTPGRPA